MSWCLSAIGIRIRRSLVTTGCTWAASHSWRRGSVSMGHHDGPLSVSHESLWHACRPCFHQGILDGPDEFVRENGPRVHRARYRILPRSQHLLHLLADARVHHGIRLHKRLEEIAAKVERVRRADILHNRVQHVQSRKLLAGRGLGDLISILRTSMLEPKRRRRFVMGKGSRAKPTLRMCCCRTSAMARACSVFSRAMTVKLLISKRKFPDRSSSARR